MTIRYGEGRRPGEEGYSSEQIVLKRIDEVYRSGETYLDLARLNLVSVPRDIGKLVHLESLDIDSNRIVSLPKAIGNLTNLTQLHIDGNNLKFLPEEIGSLNKLERLYLSHNDLANLPPEIGQLTKLTFLDIANNHLTALPSEIGRLENLTSLDLTRNKIHNLPPEIGQLTKLNSLILSVNPLSDLPSEITHLINLNTLILRYNEFEIIPTQIGTLRNLRILDFSSLNFEVEESDDSDGEKEEYYANKISSIPVEILNLENLQSLDLRGNPLPVPPEILSKINEPAFILTYYMGSKGKFAYQDWKPNHIFWADPGDVRLIDLELAKSFISSKPINELKFLVVGQGSVGKTSLVRRLVENDFDSHELKTEGVSIVHWQLNNKFETEKQSSPIQLNIWDFGGQEIMHATHQFFLTKRSLYLLVFDSRLTQEENRVEYWLKIIQSFGGESPTLVVGNKIDQHPLDIDRTGLQKKYPNIVGILETSAATGAGIEELKAAITEQVNSLPHVRDLLPETWFTVKTKLEELGHQSNFITYDKYVELCSENEVSNETSQRNLISFLHDLGVVLHFQDDPRLEALGILNPQWVTNGVYKILNSHTLFQNKGVLTVFLLDNILNLPEYPRGKRLFIVDMMKKFELCYDIEPDKSFLVPDLLPKDEPQLNFNGISAFEYAYPVLPSSVITRFIVRMNQHICEGCVWRTGVLLQMGNNTALVKADIEDRKITIAIDGLEHTRRDALSAIRYQLDEIHNSIKGLDAQKRVPIPNAPNAEPLDYDYLLQLERDGFDELPVKDGNRLVKINVRQILSGIESEAQRKEHGSKITNIYVGGNIGGNVVVGDENRVANEIQNSFNKVETSNIQPELKQTLKQLTEAVDAMTRSLPEEQAAEAAKDLSKLVDEATRPSPNKKWYSVSIDGLIKAAENVEKVGEPVINLSRKMLSLLTGGVIQ